MVLKNQIFGRRIVLVGNDSGFEKEWLRRFEFAGSQDEIGGQTAREDVARRAACEKQQASKHEDWSVPLHFGYGISMVRKSREQPRLLPVIGVC